MDHLPFPFSELEGVHPGMTLKELKTERPGLSGGLEHAIWEDIGDFRIAYWFDLKPGLLSFVRAGDLESVHATRPVLPQDSLGEGIAVILDGFSDSVAVCWQRRDPGHNLRIGRKLGDYELLVWASPEIPTQSIEGRDTIPARTGLTWRRHLQSRENEDRVACPDSMASTQGWYSPGLERP